MFRWMVADILGSSWEYIVKQVKTERNSDDLVSIDLAANALRSIQVIAAG